MWPTPTQAGPDVDRPSGKAAQHDVITVSLESLERVSRKVLQVAASHPPPHRCPSFPRLPAAKHDGGRRTDSRNHVNLVGNHVNLVENHVVGVTDLVIDTVTADDVNGEQTPVTSIRLKGRKAALLTIDPTTDMVLTQAAVWRAARLADREACASRSKPGQRPRKPHSSALSSSQRLFARVHCTTALSCLFAVQRAYSQRDAAERRAVETERVWRALQRSRDVRQGIQRHRDDRRHRIIRDRQRLEPTTLSDQNRLPAVQTAGCLPLLTAEDGHRADVISVPNIPVPRGLERCRQTPPHGKEASVTRHMKVSDVCR